jgi:hypothetical protein
MSADPDDNRRILLLDIARRMSSKNEDAALVNVIHELIQQSDIFIWRPFNISR